MQCSINSKFNIEFWILNFEFWILNFEFWILNLEFWNKIQNSEFKNSKFKIQNSKFKIQNPKFKIQNSKFRIQNSKFKIRQIIYQKYLIIFFGILKLRNCFEKNKQLYNIDIFKVIWCHFSVKSFSVSFESSAQIKCIKKHQNTHQNVH